MGKLFKLINENPVISMMLGIFILAVLAILMETVYSIKNKK